MANRSKLDLTALVLAAIAAINWGTTGLFDFNVVEALVGSWPAVAMIVYALIGLSGLYLVYWIFKK